MRLSRLKPAVPKCWLFFACGVMWSAVGLMMCARAAGWLVPEGIFRGGGFELAGMAMAIIVLRLGFGGIARKNIQRLRRLPERGCFFAFQAWKSYLIIMVMIALGITLRHLPIPHSALSLVYTTIGGALFMGSFYYYGHLLRLLRVVSQRHP
ncbi:conserved membrane hypothetical protein [Desulfosarcina cetonica]|uniref:hypothetical protein n=1 Tax=Desulfosarcina cetonica TaxID=90730 RepID=UPI0006D1DCCE|nr:hypothetical protein [Desulfosarcina cetonica]VTR68992.1 conserved membrane hypothetical protein [Desulfosarcina cetonica]